VGQSSSKRTASSNVVCGIFSNTNLHPTVNSKTVTSPTNEYDPSQSEAPIPMVVAVENMVYNISKEKPNPYLRKSIDPKKMSLLCNDHFKFLFEPQSDSFCRIRIITTNTSRIPSLTAVVSVMITPPLQERIDQLRPFISRIGSCEGSPTPRMSLINRSVVVVCDLRIAHKLVQQVCRGPEPLKTVH